MGKTCPVTSVINILSRKYALLILRQMNGGQKRFNELLKEVGNISPRTLSKRLKELEKAGLVRKRQFNEIPPRVEYNLTVSGKDLIKCFKSLNNWVKKWRR